MVLRALFPKNKKQHCHGLIISDSRLVGINEQINERLHAFTLPGCYTRDCEINEHSIVLLQKQY